MPKRRPYPTSPKQHAINRKAESILSCILAKDWLVHPIRERDDYGRDLFIESIVDFEPSGKMFHVQLKGIEDPKFNGLGHIIYPIETRVLRYYWERVSEPAFLFLIDITAEQGWYCFIQGELAAANAKEKLAKQQTMGLTIRLDNKVRDTVKLRAALDHAIAFMREKNPGSLQAAFRAAAAKHVEIDPHFKISGAHVKEGQTRYDLIQIKPFSLSLTVAEAKVPAVAPKIASLFEYGKPIELTTDEVDFAGLPLFDKAKADGMRGHVLFVPENAVATEIMFSSENLQRPFSLTLTGKFMRGTKGCIVSAKIAGAPLGAEVQVNREDLEKKQVGAIRFTWELAEWIGKPLVNLPHLEPVTAFLRAITAGEIVKTVLTQLGNRLVGGRTGGRPSEILRGEESLCRMLILAREAALAAGFKTVVPDAEKIAAFEWGNVEIAHDLIKTGQYQGKAPGFRLQFDARNQNEPAGLLFKDSNQISGSFCFQIDRYAVEVLGDSWLLGDVLYEVGPTTCHLIKPANDNPYAEIRGTPETVLRITRRTKEVNSA